MPKVPKFPKMPKVIEREGNFITPPRRTLRGVGYEPDARAGFEPVNAYRITSVLYKYT